MQRIARLTRMSERKVARVKKKIGEKVTRARRKQRNEHETQATGSYFSDKLKARSRLRQEWNRGPIAPKWDARPDFLGMSTAQVLNDQLQPHELDARTAWCGGRHTLCLAVGDRVAVVDGHFKGKIGVISKIYRTRAEVTIAGITTANVQIPDSWLPISKNTYVSSDDVSIPISWVRLVHPLPDPVTGIVKDTIIHQLVASNVTKDRPTRSSFWLRVIPRLHVAIPWPSRPETDQDGVTYDIDTKRIDVDKVTFAPTLIRPPMPPAVINELRNYYSRYRTRHEPEYVARKEKEEQEKKDRLRHQVLSMRTPLESKNILSRLQRKIAGPPRLTDDMMTKLGELMAKKRPDRLNALKRKLLMEHPVKNKEDQQAGQGGAAR